MGRRRWNPEDEIEEIDEGIVAEAVASAIEDNGLMLDIDGSESVSFRTNITAGGKLRDQGYLTNDIGFVLTVKRGSSAYRRLSQTFIITVQEDRRR